MSKPCQFTDLNEGSPVTIDLTQIKRAHRNRDGGSILYVGDQKLLISEPLDVVAQVFAGDPPEG